MRKCTRYIFLFFLVAIAIASSIYLVQPKEKLDATNEINSLKLYNTIGSNDEDEEDIFQTDNQGFYIKNYVINISVAENNVLHISETIDCDFYSMKHGIYREIPMVNNIKREDGKDTSNVVEISNIKVSEPYTKSKSGTDVVLKIGNANAYVIGDKTYVISYDYNLGKDHIKKYDELYFNIIGTNWKTHIEKVNFTIEMPKDFDKSALGFTSGYQGDTSNNVEYKVDGRVITGKTTSKLLAHQALTVRLQLPENYFVGEGNVSDVYLVISYVVPVLLFVLVLLAFIIARKRNKKTRTVEFYPPEGLTSVDVALIYKGGVSNKDVVSLLVVMADKGYIKIEKLPEGKDNYKIVKCKDYDGENSQEKQFMKALFGSVTSDEVKMSELKELSFPGQVSTIVDDVNDKDNKRKYFDTKLTFIRIIAMILSFCAMIVSSSIMLAMNNVGMIVLYVFPIVGVIFLRYMYKHGMKFGAFITIFMLLWAGVPLLASVVITKDFGMMFLIASVLGVLYGMIMFVFADSIYFRTKNGGELYAKIVGFRHFLKTAEKARLEALCESEPSYFYNILPYAYVLGVSDVWIKKFEDIAVPQPEWYETNNDDVFSIFVCNSMLTKATSATIPKSSGSSSGGGFSGGGFSGGGSGGGGGGSW